MLCCTSDADKKSVCPPQYLNHQFWSPFKIDPITFQGVSDFWGTDAYPPADYGTLLFPQVASETRAMKDLQLFWFPAICEFREDDDLPLFCGFPGKILRVEDLTA